MKKQFQSKSVPRGTRTIWRYLSALFILFTFAVGNVWAETFTMADIFTGSNQSATVTSPVAATVSTTASASNAAASKLSNDGNYFQIVLSSGSFTAASINGYINTTNTSKNWGFQFTTDGGTTWATEVTQANDGTKSAHDIAVGVTIPSGANGIRVTRRAGTSTYVYSISLTLASGGGSDPIKVTSVAVTAPVDGHTYYVGDQVTLAATVLPANATDKTLNWTMDVNDKATIADGKITFTEAGDFHLTATAADGSGKSNKVHLYVSNPIHITSVALDYDEQHINVGDVITITPTILPANATNKNLLWSVTDGATITQEGVLTAVAQSDVIVTAEAQDGSSISATTHIYIDALPACATLTPAESGSAIAAGDAIDLQETEPNASMRALTTNISYTANGLLFGSSSSTKAEVTLNHLMQVGTVITATIYNDNNDKARGLNLLNSAGTSKATWTKTQTGDHVETYTVVAGDGLAGSNVFQLQRNNNAYLKDLKVSNCGAELYALSSAIYPTEAANKATITLSKSMVAEGGTATATYSAIDPAYDFDEWLINGATIDNAKANPVTITMGSSAATITLKLKAAEVKKTVTYYDNTTELGTELVVVGENPTATGIVAPKKIGYTFAGWSTTNGGDATALSGISVAADMPLYAVYNAVNCSALSGTIFSLILNNAPAANCTIKNASGFDQEADLIKYGTVSGGIALAKNSSSNNHIVITTDPKLRLLGGSGKVHIQFDCALKEGDKIRTTIENQNISYTTTDVRSTTNNFVKGTAKEVTITKDHVLENATEIYLWSASSSDGKLISLEVIRPEKLAVTFNMHGHGTQVEPQNIVSGGKVSEPADPSASGWDFGGWYKESTYDNEWDFDNDVVSAATELHAKWTVHVAKYTVKYMDGTTELGSEQVNVGSTPAGLASDPEKDCYTFAAWDPALNTVSGEEDDVVEVNATWTPRYASSFNFGTTTDLTKDNIASKLDAKNIACSVGTSGSYDAGGTTGYLGYKFKNNGDYVAFLVQEGYEAIVTYGYTESGWTVNGTDAGVATATKAYVDKKYQAPAGGGAKLFKLVNQSADSKTSVLSNIVIQEIPALDNDATLSDLKVGGVTVDGFSSSIHTYHYELPYGTAEADIPAISATAHSAKAKQVAIQQAVWAGDPYNCYRAQANVQAEDESWGYNDVRFSFGPKYGVELIKATHTGEKTATVTGYIGGTYDKNTQGNGKLGSNGHYFGIKLAEGNFQAGDFVEVKASVLEGGNTATMFTDKGETALISGAFDANLKVYRFTLTAETEWIYIYRQSSACNPRVQSIAVYRLMPAFIEEFAITGVEDFVIDQENKTITASVANTFDVTSLTPTVKYWGNGGGAIDKTGAQNFTNPVQYTVSSAYAEDATGDYAPVTYTVTINKIAPAETPNITTDPVSANYIEGASIAALSVAASVTDGGTLSYQWYLGADAIDGATAATYQPTVSAIGSYAYKCVVTNTLAGHPAAEATSAVATIVIAEDPSCKGIGYGTARDLAKNVEVVIDATTGLKHISSVSDYDTGKKISGESNLTTVKLGGSSAYYDIYTTEKNIGSIALSLTSSSNGEDKRYKYAVIFCKSATFAAADILGVVEQTGGAGDDEQVINTPEVPLGTKLVRIMRQYTYGETTYGQGNSSYIYYIRACLVEPAQEVVATVTAEPAGATYCPSDAVAALNYALSIEEGASAAYQWYKGTDAIDGANASTYTPSETGVYTCKASLTKTGRLPKELTSAEATVTFKAATAITTAPENKRGVADAQVTLSVVATGANLAYAWYTCDDETGANPVAVPAATEASLQVTITAGMHQYYQVVVTGDCGVESAVALVEEWSEVERANVTGSRTWDWTTAGMGEIATQSGSAEYLMANVSSAVPNTDAFRSDMLLITGNYANRNSSNKAFQGWQIRFFTEVPGKVSVRCLAIHNTAKVTINGTVVASSIETSYTTTPAFFVPAGWVTIEFENNSSNEAIRVNQVVFNAAPDYTRDQMLGAGVFGTLCVDHNVPLEGISGATFYELAGREPEYGKLAFDEIVSGDLVAGKPYVFQAHGDLLTLFFGLTKVDDPVNANGMYGTFTDQTLTELDDVYYFAQRALWSCVDLTSLSLPANRAYVKLSEINYLSDPTPAPGRRRVTMAVNGEAPQVTTGMENLNAGEQPVKMIINGQLFILRGEKMYDVTGKLVK